MNRKATKIIIIVIVLVVLVGAGIGIRLYYANRGPVKGKIEFGVEYHLTQIRPTACFDGAMMSKDSYFKINYQNRNTGELYLVGLNATSEAIPLIITKYKEGVKYTVIEFEFVLNHGTATKVHRLQAISTNDEIRIKAVEPHGVEIIQQDSDNTATTIDYEVTILVFQKEAANAAA